MIPSILDKRWNQLIYLQREQSLQSFLAWKLMGRYVLIPLRLPKNSTHFHFWLKNFHIVLISLVKAMWRIIIKTLELAKSIFLFFFLCLKRRSLNICANKANGLDGIPARFIQDSASIVTMPIAHLINLSMITGVVPDDMKSAYVVPYFKKSKKKLTWYL